MKESLVGFLSDVVRQALGGGAGRDDAASSQQLPIYPCRYFLDVTRSFPSYIDFCYNSTLFGFLFLIVTSRFKQAPSWHPCLSNCLFR